jgi:vacuolar-type H+-ATPase subunit F/Vma7
MGEPTGAAPVPDTGRIAVIGQDLDVQGFGLAGALVLPAGDAAAVERAWDSLPGDVAVVILTAPAARVLHDRLAVRNWPLVAVLPP